MNFLNEWNGFETNSSSSSCDIYLLLLKYLDVEEILASYLIMYILDKKLKTYQNKNEHIGMFDKI